jgi:hypothetical protein
MHDIRMIGHLFGFDGSVWNQITTVGASYGGHMGPGASCNKLLSIENQLFIGGSFIEASIFPTEVPANNITVWDGSSFYPLGSGINNRVYDKVRQDDYIVAVGGFSQAGGKPAANIARYLLTTNPDMTCIRVPADYASIQQAIDAAFYSDTIRIAAGTFPITSTISNTSVSNLHIKGSREEDGSNASIITTDLAPGTLQMVRFFNVIGCTVSGMAIKNGLVGILFRLLHIL